ncbi:hypothetical protein C2E23DRAFT_197474 [Lenzites betulinus]|nr:hypothetical protein C2E23DRAFT_197474 [Lenzites betulinus]
MDSPSHNTATLLFSFLLGFLGLSCASIVGGLVWQRVVAARWLRRNGHLLAMGGPLGPPSIPKMWDVCIRDALSAPELSECAREQLRPLALRLTPAADRSNPSGQPEDSRPAKWKFSSFRRERRAFQTHHMNTSDADEDLHLDGCQASIAVVIVYPSCTIKGELSEFSIGTANMPCTELQNGRVSLMFFQCLQLHLATWPDPLRPGRQATYRRGRRLRLPRTLSRFSFSALRRGLIRRCI